MTPRLAFVPTRCAICHTLDNASELYAANFDESAFDPAVFSARRLPDRIHYRLVRCRSCGLVRSDPVADATLIHDLYARSTFDYGTELAGLRTTYGRYLAKVAEFGVGKSALLEVGGGNGFFLEEALAQGFASVRGVEPSRAAIDQAGAAIKPCLVCDVMRPGLFPPESFDVICMFHVFDHLPDPGSVLAESRRLLRPGGVVLCICHDVKALSARLLGERSPIVDIEHTYLFGPESAGRLFRDAGFVVRALGAVWNVYSLSYVVRLLPGPAGVKRPLLRLFAISRLGKLRLALPLGNMYLVGQRPLEAATRAAAT